MTPKIHYTPTGIPTHVTGGGTTIDLSVTWAWIPATSSLSPG